MIKEKHLMALMKCAEAWAECSNAVRLKVGAVAYKDGAILATGYNGMPAAISGPCEDENGNTRVECVHAEDNLLRKLTRSTESSVGVSIVCTHSACLPCSVKLVDAGIDKFYYKHDYRDGSGITYLKDNGVVVFKVEE